LIILLLVWRDMDFENKTTAPTPDDVEFAPSPTIRKPLEILCSTEALLRRPTVATLATLLPPKWVMVCK
jgi:hypothetical protein